MPGRTSAFRTSVITSFTTFLLKLLHFGCTYRTLHSYDLIWVVCYLFPQQRWRMYTHLVSGNHWPGEPRDLRKTTSIRKFRPAFGATSKTHIFYKHSFSFDTNSSQQIHALSSVWHSSYSSTGVKCKKMDKPRRHSFLQYTSSKRLFPDSEKRLLRTTKKKDILNM